MQRLRSLSEAECYARCYGERDESVTLLGIGRQRLKLVESDEREAFSVEPAPETEPHWSGWAAPVPFPQRPG
jgi:hypothetical protein